ncbi:hypothetical protein NDU88_013256 [Pleurodeles waltl]|uniref:Uncharacterized protein n=1 Tax=Pleurodeles waltl TaxID=8319 RepID=A0AAV7R8F6_PLEWA|nr:hypothetical protein NDU88_013256 [Pleurodeles waltl]
MEHQAESWDGDLSGDPCGVRVFLGQCIRHSALSKSDGAPWGELGRGPMRRSLWGVCDGPDWADPHTAPTCSATASREPDALSASSNHDIPEPSRREPRCLKGPLTLPGRLAFGSVAEERETTDREKKEGVDDGESRDVSSRSPSWAEPAVPSAYHRPKENTKRPVVPSRDKGDRLREAGRECQPHFRRSVADAGVWGFWGRVREDGRRRKQKGEGHM